MRPEHVAYLNKFSETRRMKRDVTVLAAMPDPLREAVGLPLGTEGEYFVGGLGDLGEECDPSIIDHNVPPDSQPGLWCDWMVTENIYDNDVIEWSGNEKFYDYVEWIYYLRDRFFQPWGYTLNGIVMWQGECDSDSGDISIEENEINVWR